jgi:hypothetical protein
MKAVVRGFVALLLSMIVSMAQGITYTATGQGDATNKTLDASATFAVVNHDLVITLSNTAKYDADDANDILTALFFKISGDPALTGISAVLGSDTAVKARPGVSGPGMNVGGEWSYRDDLTDLPDGATVGISSASLKQFTAHMRFGGLNLQGPTAPGGVQYGMTTAFDTLGNDKSSIKRQQLIENTVVFTMGGVPNGFTLADISDVSFQYGTDVKNSDFDLAGAISGQGNGGPVIPEPSPTALVAAGLLGTFVLARRSRISHRDFQRKASVVVVR